MNPPQFRLKHIGINTPDDMAAQSLANRLCELFGIRRGDENSTHIFAGSLFEVMKNEKIGACGHIAVQTENVEKAVEYFREKGVGILEDTVRRGEDGKITFAYLDLEVGGFAVHLTL